MVGDSKREKGGKSIMKVEFILSKISMSIIESPPILKKSSSIPT